eukprot:6120805-Amphidinium_carterae.2
MFVFFGRAGTEPPTNGTFQAPMVVCVEGGSPCLMDGSEQIVGNPTRLRRMLLTHIWTNDSQPRARPLPLALWGPQEVELERQTLADLDRLRQQLCDYNDSFGAWKHLSRTPGPPSPAEPIPFTQGGMAPKRRPYPLAGIEIEPHESFRRVHIIFHGSFAPFHQGHVSCLEDTKRLLQSHGLEILSIVVGCTTAKQLLRKHDGDATFAEPGVRAALIKAVLKDSDMQEVKVASEGFGSGDELAWRYGGDELDCSNIHLLGSDVRKKASPYTVIVQRTKEGEPDVAHFDAQNLSGHCSQQRARGSSSTQIREKFSRGEIPEEYKEHARAALRKILAHPAVAGDMDGVGQARAVETVPKAKPMPKRRAAREDTRVRPQRVQREAGVIDLVEAENRGAPENVPVDRPPLQRRRPHVEPDRDDRPPLRRRRRQEALPRNGPEDIADRTRRAGCMRFARPLYAHLGTFHRNVIVPICHHLLKVSPTATGRRNDDEWIRVHYVPLNEFPSPQTIFTNLDQFEDLRHALGQIACNYMYIAMTITDFYIVDKDVDTERGMKVKKIFEEAGAYVSQGCLWASTAFMVAMYEAHHLVCVMRTAGPASIGVVSGQVCQLLNELFAAERRNNASCGQAITFTVDVEKCVMVQGGMLGDVAGSSSSWTSDFSSDDSKFGPQNTAAVLYRADQESVDPVADCIAWLIKNRGDKIADEKEFARYLRVVTRVWLTRACKHSWLVAAQTISSLALYMHITEEDCIARICDPGADVVMTMYFVYAVACLIDLDVAVLNTKDERQDGYVRAKGYGLKKEGGTWMVTPPYVPVFACCEVSTTLPHITPSQEHDSVLEVLPFSGVTPGHSDSVQFVKGGAGGIWGRCIRQWKDRALYRVTIVSGKARPMVITYKNVISSKRIIHEYAKQKRVGRAYLTLVLPCVSGRRLVKEDSSPILIRQRSTSLTMKNDRYARNNKRIREERLQDDLLHQFLVDDIRVDKAIQAAPMPEQEMEKEDDGTPTPIPSTIIKNFQVRFVCDAAVPSNWSLEKALKVIRRAFYLPQCTLKRSNGVLEVKVSPELFRKAIREGQHPTLVHGAGRCRVQADAVAANARGLILGDIQHLGLQWDQKLVVFLLHHDRKCTLACFQAKSGRQRMQALMAALLRMGLPDHAARLKTALETTELKGDHGRDGSLLGEEADWRTETPGISSGSIVEESKFLPEDTRTEAISKRLEALETWAHACDGVTSEDPNSALISKRKVEEFMESSCQTALSKQEHHLRESMMSTLREMQQRLDAMADSIDSAKKGSEAQEKKEATQSQESMAADPKSFLEQMEENAVRTITAILPLTRQGLMVEHKLVAKVLHEDLQAVRAILQGKSDALKYMGFAKALIRQGYDREGQGLMRAAKDLHGKGQHQEAAASDVKEESTGHDEMTYPEFDMEASGSTCEGENENVHQAEQPARKRGRPRGTTKGTTRTIAEELRELRENMGAVQRQVAKLNGKGSSPHSDGDVTTLAAKREQKSITVLAHVIERMDIWLAELGEANLRCEESVKQIRAAVGMGDYVPQDENSGGSAQELSIPIAIQLIESRILAIERDTGRHGDTMAGAEAGRTIEARLEACEKKIVNYGTLMERFARACQMNWNNGLALAQRLHVVHETASLALQQSVRLGAQMASVSS